MIEEKIEQKTRLAEQSKRDDLLKKEKGIAMQEKEALIMMMKMQMKEQQEHTEKEPAEVTVNRYEPSPVESTGEREELRARIVDLENKLDDMDMALEDTKKENQQFSKWSGSGRRLACNVYFSNIFTEG